MKLSDSIKINTMTLKNRLYAAPMVLSYADENGNVTDKLKSFYRAKAEGGWGLVCVEASNVMFSGRNFARMLGIFDDRQLTGLNELAEAVRDGGAKSCIQLQHAGRQSDGRYTVGAPVIAPSATAPWPPGANLPKEMTEGECDAAVDAFVQAAGRAQEAGFDAVLLHGTHGFLIQQFMSPYTNKRTDKYGDRLFFVTEIIRKVRQKVGQGYPVGIRLAADEFLGEKGITVEWTVKEAVGALEKAGIDWFDITSGVFETLVHWIPPIYFDKAYLIGLAEKVKAVATVPVSGIGKIHDAQTARKVVEEGRVDFVAVGRQVLADHDFASKVLSGKDDDINQCICCDVGCTDRLLKQYGIQCTVNFEVGKDASVRAMAPADQPKKVMVVGGGVAGMQAALILKQRGHNVTLFEKDSRLGGMVRTAATLPKLSTAELAQATKQLDRQLKVHDVDVRLETEVTSDVVKRFAPDVILMAIGARPDLPNIPGIEKANVFTVDEFLRAKIEQSNKVVVIGGNYGAEAAVSLARLGKQVTMVEETASTATVPYIYLGRMLVLQAYLAEEKVEILTETKVREIRDDAAVVVDKDGKERVIAGDAFVIAVGRTPNTELVEEFSSLAPEVYAVGDCTTPHSIYQSIYQASLVARRI